MHTLKDIYDLRNQVIAILSTGRLKNYRIEMIEEAFQQVVIEINQKGYLSQIKTLKSFLVKSVLNRSLTAIESNQRHQCFTNDILENLLDSMDWYNLEEEILLTESIKILYDKISSLPKAQKNAIMNRLDSNFFVKNKNTEKANYRVGLSQLRRLYDVQN